MGGLGNGEYEGDDEVVFDFEMERYEEVVERESPTKTIEEKQMMARVNVRASVEMYLDESDVDVRVSTLA